MPRAMPKRLSSMTLAESAVLSSRLLPHASRLEGLARRLLGDAEEARDVLQTVHLRAMSQSPALEDADAAYRWARRVLVNEALGLLRRRRLWNRLGALLLVPPTPAPAADEAEEQQAHLRALAAAVDTLPAKQAAAFRLRYLEGLTLDELADALGVERGTARVHLQRAVAALRARGVLPPPEPGGAP